MRVAYNVLCTVLFLIVYCPIPVCSEARATGNGLVGLQPTVIASRAPHLLGAPRAKRNDVQDSNDVQD